MIVRKYYGLCLLMILTLITCSPREVSPDSSPQDYGCKPPPTDVFTTVGVDLEFTQSTFGKVMTGDINIETDPQVIALATKAVTDDRIRNYLRCLAIRRDKYTNEQAAYFDLKSDFMVTKPTTEQFLEWQNNYPYPKVRRDDVSGGQVNNFNGPTTFNNSPEIAKSVNEVVTPPGKNNNNSWQIVSSGKQITPEEGKLYTHQFPDGGKVNYLLKDDKMHVEHLNPEGDNAYYVLDHDRNVDVRKLHHKLKEYTVVIPDGLEISRKTTALNNGYQQIRIELKWGKSIDMIFDSNKQLQWLHITGGSRINNNKKTITPKLPDKIN